ncbi:MAG: TerC family protein [Bdellovibrionales bacterium]|nr:TerC family protein [Bdellovibrionales bacterium]
MMDFIFTAEGLTALATLSVMEIVLGIDNIIFISILVSQLPSVQQKKARSLGIFLALFLRLILLFSITWIMGLKEPFFTLFEKSFSGRDLILLGGGLFLIFKSTIEIHNKVERSEEVASIHSPSAGIFLVLFQIIVLDLVFSFDSVITAVGMVQQVPIMITAMSLAMLVMLMSAGAISGFVDRHPTVKILALSFLLMIGVMLVVEGMGGHVSKAYIYFAMFFSLTVELLNLRYRMNRPLPGIKLEAKWEAK